MRRSSSTRAPECSTSRVAVRSTILLRAGELDKMVESDRGWWAAQLGAIAAGELLEPLHVVAVPAS